jgi:D-amino-acid dehydrogenase
LQLFRKQAQLDHTADDIAVLKQYGVPYEVLDRDGCIAAEPALARVEIAGGLRLLQDETGDCQMFTAALAEQAPSSACSSSSTSASTGSSPMVAASPASPPAIACCTADAYVVALAAGRSSCCAASVLPFPSMPSKGYSITVPVRRSGRTGLHRDGRATRSRSPGWQPHPVGGTAEVSGYSTGFIPRAAPLTIH